MSTNLTVSDHADAVGLDPQAAAWLQHAEEGWVSSGSKTLEEKREHLRLATIAGAGVPEAVARIENCNLPGPGGDIPVRIYTPEEHRTLPLLVWFHGGGWAFGDLDLQDGTCRFFANAVPCIVLSVGYRLAPEFKFPAGVEDAYAATQWAANHSADLGYDGRHIAVGGESAGGNFAAVVSLMARDRGQPTLCFQLLVNPATNLASVDTPSREAFSHGFGMNEADVEWIISHYLEKREDVLNPYVSPLLAGDLRNTPPAMIITSQFDMLRDEGEAYAKRLQEAGVPTHYQCYSGMIHGFFVTPEAIDRGREARADAVRALQSAFAK